MSDVREQETQRRARDCCDWAEWRVGRSGGVGFGIVLVAVGLLWYGVKAGWFFADWWHSGLLWPAVMILVGALILFHSLLARKAK